MNMKRRLSGWRRWQGAGHATVGLLSLALGWTGVACVPADRDADLKPPADFALPALRPLSKEERKGRGDFGSGFYALEGGADGRTWRWMRQRGEIRVENDRQPHTLRLSGWLPLELLAAPPTIRITLQGRLLETFVGRERTLRKQYRIPADALGDQPTVLLVIETNALAHAPGDPRDLGVSIEQLRW